MKIRVIHGPNLNLLGTRETNLYGINVLNEINELMVKEALKYGFMLECIQHNSEGDLVDVIQSSQDYDFVIINPAAYTHTSIAMRDAFLAINTPFIEVHLSNIYKREEFRHKSYLSDIAIGVISGLGVKSYLLALNYAIDYLLERK